MLSPLSPMLADTRPLLEVRQLEVVYNHVATAVQGVSIEVADRQIVAVIGTNGAGKTTTLRAISGFLPAEDVAITDGSVAFAGKPITGNLPHHVSRRGVVLVPERNKLFDTLTVEENLHFNLTRRRRAIRDKVFTYFPRLGERKSQIAGLLSGGEKQMLAIGMSLVCEPKLLLVDELSLGLAPIVTEEIMGILQGINKELGLAMLIVEQNAAAALRVASFGYVLEAGRVVFKGPSARLMQHQDVKEFYLGGSEGQTRSYRDLRQYARKRRWWG
jgi:branched-chain amino acid transport system ATP-binding protein